MTMFEWRWPAFFTRVTAGLLFGMTGVHKVFIMTPEVHARKLFLEPYHHTWIPHFLRWLLGVGIPFLELIAGSLLVAGYLRRPIAIIPAGRRLRDLPHSGGFARHLVGHNQVLVLQPGSH